MEEGESTGASQHNPEETEEGEDAGTFFEDAAKKESDCFPCGWRAGNHSFKALQEIFSLLFKNF